MAACGGGQSNNIPPRAEAGMPRPQSRISTKPVAGPVGSGVSLQAAIGEPGVPPRPRRWAVICRSAGQRPVGRPRVAETHLLNDATATINPGRSRSPLNAVSGRKHGLLITDFARFINSEIALLCEWQGAATHGALLVGSGGTGEEIARPLEGGLVGRALHLPQRAALEPPYPSSGDRRMRVRAPAREDRAITRRTGRRPRAWCEARGARTAQSRPPRSRKPGPA